MKRVKFFCGLGLSGCVLRIDGHLAFQHVTVDIFCDVFGDVASRAATVQMFTVKEVFLHFRQKGKEEPVKRIATRENASPFHRH